MSGGFTAFMTARYDEAEALARAAYRGPWELEEETGAFGAVAWVSMPLGHGNAKTGLTRFTPLGLQDAETSRHIAACDPEHRLADIALKRAILAEHGPADFTAYGEKLCRRCRLDEDEPPNEDDHHWVIYPCTTARQLGTEFSGHPEYKAEWKP